MADHQKPKPTDNFSSLPSTNPPKISGGSSNGKSTDNFSSLPSTNPPKISGGSSNGGFSGAQHFPNPPDRTNPDAATLREQWRFAIKQYSKWYSHAWGSAILAGLSFYALGWIIKGSNPLLSFKHEESDAKNASSSSSSSSDDVAAVPEVKRN